MIGSQKRTHRIKRCSVLLLLMLLVFQAAGFAVSASDTQVLLEMNDTKIQMGVGTTMSMVLKNLKDKAEVLSFEGLEHFEIMSHSQSNATSIINGKMTKENRVDYIMMPKETGTFKLKATVKIGKDTYETNVLTVEVGEEDASLSKINEDIFLKTTVSDDSIYFGENAVITYDLYSRYQVDEYAFTEATTCDGFIAEESDSAKNGPSYLTIDGKKYVKYTVKQLILSPTQSGEFTIPAFDFQANLSTGGFFGETKPAYLKSDEVKLSVVAVPDEGKPDGYKGLVGNMALSYAYSSDTVALNEPVTLDVTLAGEGNLYTLDSIAEHLDVSDFSFYETEDDPQAYTDEEGHSVKKHYELILIPKTAQDVTIPEMTLPYFNVVTGGYDQLKIGEKTIHVTGGGVDSDNVTGIDTESHQSTEPIVVNQVDYGDYGDDMLVITLSKQKVKVGVLFLVILLGSGIGAYWFRKKTHVKNSYQKALKKINSEGALYDLLVTYMLETHHISIRSVTADSVEKALAGHEKSEKILKLIHYFEVERYQKSMSIDVLKANFESAFQN